MDGTFTAWSTTLTTFLAGSTALAVVSHAVNTFPMPKSAIGRWFLGVIQFAVGQRLQGNFTLNGGGTAQAAIDTAVAKVASKVADDVVIADVMAGPLSKVKPPGDVNNVP